MYPFSMRDINTFSTAIQLAIVGKVLIAAVLASMIGWERDRAGKAAGTRTMALVGISATAVVAIGEALNSQFNLGDPTRALHAVVTGIGFLGAGLIFTSGKSNEIQGVTTSATVFTTACMGIAIGLGFLITGAFFAFVVMVILRSTHLMERAHRLRGD
jgi:putative Mg2+ transporter-C (MgtC) family protein